LEKRRPAEIRRDQKAGRSRGQQGPSVGRSGVRAGGQSRGPL
jgi:hypothetical protein